MISTENICIDNQHTELPIHVGPCTVTEIREAIRTCMTYPKYRVFIRPTLYAGKASVVRCALDFIRHDYPYMYDVSGEHNRYAKTEIRMWNGSEIVISCDVDSSVYNRCITAAEGLVSGTDLQWLRDFYYGVMLEKYFGENNRIIISPPSEAEIEFLYM